MTNSRGMPLTLSLSLVPFILFPLHPLLFALLFAIQFTHLTRQAGNQKLKY